MLASLHTHAAHACKLAHAHCLLGIELQGGCRPPQGGRALGSLGLFRHQVHARVACLAADLLRLPHFAPHCRSPAD